MTNVEVPFGAKPQDTAVLLLAAAEQNGGDPSVVRTTTGAFVVPEEIAEAAGVSYNSDESAPLAVPQEPQTTDAEPFDRTVDQPEYNKTFTDTDDADAAVEVENEEASKAPAKRTPAKKTAAKKTAAKES